MRVSNRDIAPSVNSTSNHPSRNNRKPCFPSGLYVSKSSQESLFFFAEASCILFWSRLSDRIGRKPVLMVASNHGIESLEFAHDTPQGIAGLMISMTSFGLSKTFTGLAVRCSRNPLPMKQ